MFSVCLVMSIVCTPTLCEEANKELFEQWGGTLHIPEITLGVPATQVIEDSFVLLDGIYKKLVASTRGELLSNQRDLVVPFAMAMIEGTRASQGDEVAAKLCLKHLVELEDAVTGWSASRLWRMRLHAYTCLNMDEEIRNCIEKIDEVKTADIEDQTASALANERTVFSAWDQKLATQNRNDLRWFFACGMLAQHPEDTKNIFSVADDLVNIIGVNRIAIDVQLVGLLERLDPPIVVGSSSTHKLVSLLAQRTFASECLSDKKYILAKKKLLALVQAGCAFSAQQLLTTLGIELSRDESNDAIELVLQSADETTYELSYWQLFAGAHFVRIGNKDQASEYLSLIAKTSPYYEDAQAIQKLILGSDVRSLQKQLDQAATKGKSSIVEFVEHIQPAAATQLLQHYVGLWHREGVLSNPWLSNVVVALLAKTPETSLLLRGEANRLLGRVHVARQLFEESKRERGVSLQVAVGLADCNRDPVAMQSAIRGLALGEKNDFWFWLANSRMIRWHCEDGGNKMKAHAKVNRLKQLDPSLGGEQFAGVFREALR